MRYTGDGRRLPSWIRLYTNVFGLVKAATPYQAGEALKSAVHFIMTGKEPDITDSLVAGIYELLMDGAEYSIEEYAAKIEGGRRGAEITNGRAAGEPRESRGRGAGEARESFAYLREREREKEKETEREQLTPSELKTIADRKKVNASSGDILDFLRWVKGNDWKMNGKPITDVGEALKTYIEHPEKIGVI